MARIELGAAGGRLVGQLAGMSNRHGLIAGATGTGKTVTLQVLAEGFSALGVPVFAPDMKGDLAGLARPGAMQPRIEQRLQQIPLPDFQLRACPVVLWDLHGRTGHPLRTTVSELGPLLLGNILQLNDTQTGVLFAAFKLADAQGLLLLDLKDLRALLGYMSEHAAQLSRDYGLLPKNSIAAVQRALLVLEEQGGTQFFGEPALQVQDLIVRDFEGRGVVHLLDASSLIARAPAVYASFLLWLLAELYEALPERGDAELPVFVLFFDEAHLLFDNAPRALLDRIEQVVRLIRSKGVGVYFVTQNPRDVPADVAAQLGLRVQHALRAYTPAERKALNAVVESFRENPALDTRAALTELGTGEALVSVLDDGGRPTPVERVLIRPPGSRIGPLTDAERAEQLSRSPFKGRFDTLLDRDSAYEMLKRRAEQAAAGEPRAPAPEPRAAPRAPRASGRQGVGEALVKSVVRTVGSQLGRQLTRGLLGALLGGRR